MSAVAGATQPCHPVRNTGAATGLPVLNVDVPRLLRAEYHKRMSQSRNKRLHELEALLATQLPVGHCRVRVTVS